MGGFRGLRLENENPPRRQWWEIKKMSWARGNIYKYCPKKSSKIVVNGFDVFSFEQKCKLFRFQHCFIRSVNDLDFNMILIRSLNNFDVHMRRVK